MLRNSKKLLVLIPAFNEVKVINKVINKIPNKIKGVKKISILVIDDGSTDGTKDNIRKSKRIKVIRHVINRGLGAAIKTGLTLAKKEDIDILVTMDADCQHDPREIIKMIKPIINNSADVVIGSRLLKNTKLMPLSRKIVNRIANVITYLITGVMSTDSQSGFRAFSKKAVKCLNPITERMEVSSEIFREIKKNRLTYIEVPIRSIYTNYSLMKGQSILNGPDVFYRLLIRSLRN